MQWEYLIMSRDQYNEWHRSDVEAGQGDFTIQELIRQAGSEGWEFFLIDSGTYWLKRPAGSK
jgi:hypothetical protein